MVFFPSGALAKTARCAQYQLVLEGDKKPIPGYDYKEIVEMHKAETSPGYDGRWQVDRIVQIIQCPTGGAALAYGPEVLDMGGGLWMMTKGQVIGNFIVVESWSGNFYLDVHKNKIGDRKSNTWQGSFLGRAATYRADPNNPLSPQLKGEVRTPPQTKLSVELTSPAVDRFAFDDSDEGVLEMEFTAKASPAEYEKDVEWDIPEIEGSTRTIEPASGKGSRLKIRFEGLPEQNSQFGPKTVTARLNVAGCVAEDSKTVRVFFARDAQNNPDGEFPNWFYYWKQTPAAKPRGQAINIEYGGTTVDKCRESNVPALFLPGQSHATIHVCSLKKLGPDFPIKFPILTLTPPYFKGWVTSKHIDSFAAAIIHEHEHFQVEFQYRYGKSDAVIAAEDKDQDGLPDHAERGYNMDSKKYQTFMADDPEMKKIDGDEEWLAYKAMSEIRIGQFDQYDWAKPGKQWP
jgi:hypothetical protein